MAYDANSIFVDNEEVGKWIHHACAQEIAEALARVKRTRGRETNKQADPLEERVKRMEAVWKLWLSDAEKGSISQGTFDAMKHLLGMETA
jgi:hypothetical protein